MESNLSLPKGLWKGYFPLMSTQPDYKHTDYQCGYRDGRAGKARRSNQTWEYNKGYREGEIALEEAQNG